MLSSYRQNKRVGERERHSINLGLSLRRLSARALEDMSASDHWSTTQNSLQPGSDLQCLLPCPAGHLSSVRNCRTGCRSLPSLLSWTLSQNHKCKSGSLLSLTLSDHCFSWLMSLAPPQTPRFQHCRGLRIFRRLLDRVWCELGIKLAKLQIKNHGVSKTLNFSKSNSI